MNNAEIIKGINTTIEGLETIKKALMSEADAEEKKATKSKVMEEPKEEVAKEVKEETTEAGGYTVEELKGMKYNDFKKLASKLGVKCTGTRDEIMERILALNGQSEEEIEAVEQEEKEEAPSKSDKSAGGKKLGKKKDDEPTTDEFDEQAEEIAKDTPLEDIISALADVDIKANKKNAVQKLAEALREGLIELDDEADEESEAGVDDSEEAGEEEEISATSYFEEFDPDGYNNPDDMTEERAEAIESKMDEILTSYADGTLTDEDISSYVEDNATESEIDLLGDDYTEEDILKLYMELIKRTIDNDGEEHEQGEPYEVADKDVCCGHALKYSKKTKKYICEHCGEEYEAE